MTYHTEKLILDIQAGLAPEYLFFWGHRPRQDGRVSKSCLSQWYASGFAWEEEYFRTAEHWMMAGQQLAAGRNKVARPLAVLGVYYFASAD